MTKATRIEPKFDNRSAELKWLMGWVRDLLSSQSTLRYDLMRNLTLWGSAPSQVETPGMMSGPAHIAWATAEMDRRIAVSRRRDRGLPFIGSDTFEDPVWQAQWRDLQEKQWHLKCETEMSDRPFLSLYQYARPEEGRRSVVVEQAGDLKFCLDLVEAGSAQLINGRARSGKSHWSALVFQWLDTAKIELDTLSAERRGSEARLSRLWKVRYRGRRATAEEAKEIEREYADESSIGTKEMAVTRYRGWKKILGLRTAKGLRMLTTKEVRPDSPRIERILQAHDGRTLLRDLVLNNKADLFTYVDFDEPEGDRMQQGTSSVMGAKELNRVRGHFDMALSMCAQDADEQLTDEFLSSITVRVEKESRERVRISNSLYNYETFVDVPDTEVRYIHNSKLGFNMNLRPSRIAGYVDNLRQRWEAGHDPKKDPWTEGMTLEAWLQGIPLFTVSEADQQRGVKPMLVDEIRMHLLWRDPSGHALSDKRIAQIINDSMGVDENDPESEPPYATEERVAEERKKLERDIRIDERRRGGRPPDPEDLVDQELESYAV